MALTVAHFGQITILMTLQTARRFNASNSCTLRIDHDLYHVDPNLPLSDVAQNLRSTNQLREHVLHHAGCAAPTCKHELDHTDQEYTVSALKYLDHGVGIDYLGHDLSDVWPVVSHLPAVHRTYPSPWSAHQHRNSWGRGASGT